MRRGTIAAELFGAHLCNLREKKGMSMRAVAKKIGVPPSTVSQTEKGQRALKEPNIEKWAAALDMTEEYLLFYYKKYEKEHPAPPLSRYQAKTEDEALIRLIKSLTAHERIRTLGYIDCLIEQRKNDA